MGNRLYEECQWPIWFMKDLLFVKGCANVMIDRGYSPSSLFAYFSGYFKFLIIKSNSNTQNLSTGLTRFATKWKKISV